jgi:hypothetical protein
MSKHIAIVRKVVNANQFVGLPVELSDAVDSRESMPLAEVLVIEGVPGSFMLLRYTMDGKFSGDTWHASLEDAFHQASYEFGLHGSEWKLLPDEADPIAYAGKFKRARTRAE